MSTLNQIYEEIVAQVQGGLQSTETKFAQLFVEQLIHQYRADILMKSTPTRISEIWMQSYYPEYNENIQYDDCYVNFEVPEIIDINRWGDGARYVGNVSGLDAWPRLGGGGMSAVYAAHRLTNPKKRVKISWDYSVNTTGTSEIHIYGDADIEEILVKFIFANPTDVPTYRRDTDPYPIPEDLIPDMKSTINQLMIQMAQVPQDIVPNGQDSTNTSPSNIQQPRKRR